MDKKFHDAPEAVTHNDAPELFTPQSPEVNYFQGLPASDIPASDTKDVEEEPRPRRIRGMQDSSFWLLIGLICALVIGVSVGGAVGGSMAVAKKNDQAHNDPATTVTQCVSTTTLSSTPSSCPSQSPIPVATTNPSSNCVNGTNYDSMFLTGTTPPSAGLKFVMHCQTDEIAYNSALAFVYTFEDCIEVCAGLNYKNSNKGCLGVTYHTSATRPVNCWIHNETTTFVAAQISDLAVLAS